MVVSIPVFYLEESMYFFHWVVLVIIGWILGTLQEKYFGLGAFGNILIALPLAFYVWYLYLRLVKFITGKDPD